MLDFNNLPTNQKVDRQVFYANTPSSGTQNWVAWLKPRGVNFIKILCLAGGGGGGGGVANSAVFNFGGGNGGNSSSQSIIIFPAWFLPDVLYVSVGIGGAGGAGGLTPATGSSGVNSYVSIYENTTANNLLTYANAGAGGNTQGNTNSTASVAPTSANAYISIMGQAFASTAGNIGLAGQVGFLGGSAADGTNITFPATGLIVTGGAGGGSYAAGGYNSSGGNGGGIAGIGAPFPTTIVGGAGGYIGNTTGGDGANGCQIIPNLTYFIGGLGGGGAGNNGSISPFIDIGGKGGKGFYGSGGGGGGGSSTDAYASGGGLGGDGGDGLVIITSW